MWPLALAAAGLVGWLWWTGRIGVRTLLPLLLAALAVTFLARGQLLPAGIAALVAGFVGLAGRKARTAAAADPARARIAQAEALLDLPPGYGRLELEAAYRRKAKAAHPDGGGSGEAMDALSAARALLSAELERRKDVDDRRGR